MNSNIKWCVWSIRFSALGHASGRTGTVVSEPAGQAVWVSGIVTQQLVDARKVGAIVDMVHRATTGVIYLQRDIHDLKSHGHREPELTSMIWKFLLTPLANMVSTKELATVVLSLTRNDLSRSGSVQTHTEGQGSPIKASHGL